MAKKVKITAHARLRMRERFNRPDMSDTQINKVLYAISRGGEKLPTFVDTSSLRRGMFDGMPLFVMLKDTGEDYVALTVLREQDVEGHGNVPREVKDCVPTHDLVVAALQAAEEAVAPGATAEQVDKAEMLITTALKRLGK